MTNKIIIVSGDPNSINSEIIYKCYKKLNNNLRKKIYIIGNLNLLKKQFKKLGYIIDIYKVNNIFERNKKNGIKVINVDLKFKDPFKVPKQYASKFIINSLNLAHKIAVNKDVGGIINCPISKILLKKERIGVTEYLASKCKVFNDTEVMLIRNKKLAVSPITTHIDVKQISRNIKTIKITKKINTINNWFKKKLNKKPKIGILGLNPHNAELRKNSEEKKIIIPAILRSKKKGIKIHGPLIADTVFIKDYKKYDVIIGMYHDQILPSFKTLFKFDAINITLGLKYLRTSPDHGTGLDIIGKNKANSSSLLSCIYFVKKFGK